MAGDSFSFVVYPLHRFGWGWALRRHSRDLELVEVVERSTAWSRRAAVRHAVAAQVRWQRSRA